VDVVAKVHHVNVKNHVLVNVIVHHVIMPIQSVVHHVIAKIAVAKIVNVQNEILLRYQ